MREMVRQSDVEAVFALTDRLGIHRERVIIPLAARHPGRVRKMPNGKIEIVVEAEGDLETWVAGLEPELRRLV
jgi:hypothetical protein